MTEAHKRRKPVHRHSKPAIKKVSAVNSTTLAREIIGMAIAAAIFAATMWSSVFGMSGGFDHPEAVIVAAGVADDE
jgi:hypothetical protein